MERASLAMIEIQERAVQCCHVEAIWAVLQPEHMLIMQPQLRADRKASWKRSELKIAS